MSQNNTQALARYHSLFDNAQYQIMADVLAADLQAERDSLRVSDAMNLITNVALALCTYAEYEDAWVQLATFCGHHRISIATIDRIYAYLLSYQQPGDTTADDFQLTARALVKVHAVSDPLKEAMSCANGVHGWRGRMAYQLLAAADYLVQAAAQLLMHGNLSYIGEKLAAGCRRLNAAQQEGTLFSGRPEMFTRINPESAHSE